MTSACLMYLGSCLPCNSGCSNEPVGCHSTMWLANDLYGCEYVAPTLWPYFCFILKIKILGAIYTQIISNLKHINEVTFLFPLLLPYEWR